jgi:ABC-type protease/lipase transport system fused ATPase/permease subunit
VPTFRNAVCYYHILSYSLGSIFINVHVVVFLLNTVIYVFLLLCLCILIVYTRCDKKTTVNAAAECDLRERQGSSILEAARRTLVTGCDMFQLVRCSQSVVSYG